MADNTELPEILNKAKENNKRSNPILRVIKELLAILFWVFVIIKLFIFDIDIFLMNMIYPDYVWLLDFKFLAVLGVIALIWLFTRSKYIMTWSLYILFYPIIILLWKVPYLVYKQRNWLLAIAIINSVISFIISIRHTFIIISFFLLSGVCIFIFSNDIILWISTTIIFVILIVTYIHKTVFIFKSSNVRNFYLEFLSRVEKRGFYSLQLDDNIKKLPVEELSDKQLEQWTTNLQSTVLFNRIFLFISKKLYDYQNSKLNYAYYIFMVFELTIITILSFSLINYALFKINTSFFTFDATPSFFTFFYYSFNNLLSQPISELGPALPISQTVSMVESFIAFFILAIFIGLIMQIKSQKHTNELNEIISRFEEQGHSLEKFIKEEYKVKSIEDAMMELEKLKSGLVKFLYKITESMKR